MNEEPSSLDCQYNGGLIMIKTEEHLLEPILDQAIKRANRLHHTQLVSLTKKIKPIDLMAFFEAGKSISNDRMFWTSTIDHFYIVGIGKAHEITADESRFNHTKDQWKMIQKEAIIHNPYKAQGTGLVALGGLSFDPNRDRSSLWKNFAPSQFTIPMFMVTKVDDDYYFTTTVEVMKDDHSIQLANELSAFETKLFNEMTNVQSMNQANIIHKEEIGTKKWKDSVLKAQQLINEKKAKKIVLAREMRLIFDQQVEIEVMLRKLLNTQSNSYIFAFEHAGDCFIGATPERLVKINGQHLLSTCLAGTAPRGKTEIEDQQIGKSLLQDEKNLEEHDYVVKMIADAMETYCFNINIPDQPVLFPLKNLQHLYTPVTAQLRNGHSIFDIIEKLHPTPALGGVPRDTSLAFIRDHESFERGWYGSPVGFVDSNDNGEFAVAIRSGLIRGEEASLFAGCGVMRDSNLDEEYEETKMKFLPMLTALEATI